MIRFMLRWPFIVAVAALFGLLFGALIATHAYDTAPRAILKNAQDIANQAHDAWDGDLLTHIDNATLGFQKIFVLNLPARTDNKDTVTLAASVTGLEVEFVSGVTNVTAKARPPEAETKEFNAAEIGNWRAHMNAVQYMVQHNIQSALILEDDADWDLRIKAQMKNYARAARLLIQPVPGAGEEKFLDPSYPRPKNVNQKPQSFYVNTSTTSKPTTSPYGDLKRWDMLWLGHCGTHFPEAKGINVPIGRAIILDDETVPEPQHVHMQFGDDILVENYPPHTRAVSRTGQNLCSLGYALSLPGARRLLYELSIRKLDATTDVSFQQFCNGDEVRPTRRCYTVQPQLFNHFRPRGIRSKFSDISGHGDDVNEQAFSRNIRWSTRLNLEKLVDDQTDYIDLYQDGKPFVDYGWG